VTDGAFVTALRRLSGFLGGPEESGDRGDEAKGGKAEVAIWPAGFSGDPLRYAQQMAG
jgi:hypothetical protein